MNKTYVDVDYCITWKELPDGDGLTRANFDEFMVQTVKMGQRAEETAGGIDGQLRARKKRAASGSSGK